MSLRFRHVIGAAALALWGCNKPESAPAIVSSAAPPPVPSSAVAPAPAAPSAIASVESKRALATPAPPTVKRLVHMKIVKDECTFDFDAPETLRKGLNEGTMVAYEGKLVRLQAFSGSSLGGIELGASLHKPEDTLLYDAQSDPQLHVVRIPTADKPLDRVMGAGNENPKVLRQTGLGCAFIIRGLKEAEGDILAMTRSMKMTYDEKKTK